MTSCLKVIDLRQQLRGFVFKLRALDSEILFRIFASAILEIQVAKVFVKLLLALQQKIEASLCFLACENILRPESVNNEREQEEHSRNKALGFSHRWSPPFTLVSKSVSRRMRSLRSMSAGLSTTAFAAAACAF